MISRTAARPQSRRSRIAGLGPRLDADDDPALRAAAGWRRSLADAVSSVGELLDLLDLDPAPAGGVEAAHRDFPLRVPRGFVARMRRGDPRDPLLLQVLPRARELEPVPGFGRDPLGEERTSPAPGLLHRFHGRVLLVVTGACAVHCRYCFRRHFPYAEHRGWGSGFERALAYVGARPSIGEVILSGGDPLAASDERLARLAGAIAEIPHVRRLRLHTRMPIVLPERVDERLVGWLAESRLRTVVVVHANHPREIDRSVRAALARLRRADVALLNQSVLLRGVNDRVEALRDLSEALFEAGVTPYYLHLLDRVQGAAHFEVGETEARALLRELMQLLPGYLVPRLVREVPGAPAKVPITLEG